MTSNPSGSDNTPENSYASARALLLCMYTHLTKKAKHNTCTNSSAWHWCASSHNQQ